MLLATESLEINSDSSAYNIIRRPRRRTVGIVVRTNNEIDVLAPPSVPAAVIDRFVRSKSAWIEKKLHFNREIRTAYQPKQFIDGECFSFLDQKLSLEIKNGKRGVERFSEQLIVSLPNSLPENRRSETIRKLLQQWYCTQALEYLQSRTTKYTGKAAKLPTSVAVKAYNSRWGSCHSDGRIFFNWRLIMAPAWVVDYVVVHEICHLAHHNHSRNFWQLVESLMPNYREAERWLKVHSEALRI